MCSSHQPLNGADSEPRTAAGQEFIATWFGPEEDYSAGFAARLKRDLAAIEAEAAAPAGLDAATIARAVLDEFPKATAGQLDRIAARLREGKRDD